MNWIGKGFAIGMCGLGVCPATAITGNVNCMGGMIAVVTIAFLWVD